MQVSFRGLARTPAAIAVMLAALGGCGDGREAPRDGLAADTARFTWDTRSAEVPLTACGRDGDVVALAGVRGDIVIQAEVDLGDGGSGRTGVTADLGGDGIMGAFGAEMEHGPAGEVTDVRLEGDRVIVEGTWVAFDDRLRADPGAVGGGIEGRLVARCPEDEDEGDDEDEREVAGVGSSAR